MRIWHLIDEDSPQATATTLELLSQSLDRLDRVDQRVVVLGGSKLRATLDRLGIRVATVIGTPYGRALGGLFAVQRLIRRSGPPDLVHCWSVGAVTLATMLLRRLPSLLTLTLPPTRRATHWLRMMTQDRRSACVVLPISLTIRRVLLSGGVPESAVHVLRPGLDLSKISHASRASIRKQWGIEDDDRKVVVLVCDPPMTGNAMTSALAVSLADLVKHRHGTGISLMVHPAARHRRRAARDVSCMGRPDRLIVDQRIEEPWNVMPGCDVALATGSSAGGMSLLWAMGSNLPVIGEATYAISEIVEDRHSALLAKPDQPKLLAHRICQLLEDQHLSWRLRDTARHEAYSFFSRQRYCQSLMAVYEQLVSGRPVEVPPLPSTGGLRFAGRG